MLQNLTSLDSPASAARSSRVAIKDELVGPGKLAFDDPRVFRRLALERVSPQFVTRCADAFRVDQRVLGARCELEKIIAGAIVESGEDSELEDEVEDSFGVHDFEKRGDEKKMCKPLASIFEYVEMFEDSSSTQSKHSFESTDSTVLKSDASTWGFPKGSPDFVMLQRSSSIPISDRKGILWREIGGFCVVKPTPQQGPKPNEAANGVTPLVAQAADYARLHISGRPFQLFSVGLLVFGSQFCVAVFDRDGVLFSPVHDMWEDTETFVCVVRALTCCLSPVELGRDPTVTPLPVEQRESFPTFVIAAGGRAWYTVGLPIWTSVSLLGRGTSIWLVRENGTGPVFVLKNAWRSAARLSESAIYDSVVGRHPALAKLHLGEDVRFPGEERYITTDNLRGGPTPEDNIEGEGVVLHRLLLESRGRPLWEYREEKELLQGIRAAVSAHEFLCEQDILHRDISAGNIMLSAETPSVAGAEAFLMDLEFAHIKRSSLDTTTTTPVPPLRTPSGYMTDSTVRPHTIFGPDVMRGAAMTGTAQFMAVSLLEAILTQKPIEHKPQHDIESFVYVLGYSLSRRAVLESEQLDGVTRDRLHKFFRSTFGRMALDDIYSSRRGRIPVIVSDRFPDLFSEPVSELLGDLDSWLGQSGLLPEYHPQTLTHKDLLSKLDDAIAKMA